MSKISLSSISTGTLRTADLVDDCRLFYRGVIAETLLALATDLGLKAWARNGNEGCRQTLRTVLAEMRRRGGFGELTQRKGDLWER